MQTCLCVCVCVQVHSLAIQIVQTHADPENRISLSSVNTRPELYPFYMSRKYYHSLILYPFHALHLH